MEPRYERWCLAAILVLAFGIRAIHPYQPIVENYVGRQIPTAMVARNLQKTAEFFSPRLDTRPDPNYFVIEPPVYAAAVVGVSGLTRLPLEPSGRLVSAFGIVLACWGLYGLARPREGVATALLATAIFALFPVTIRYGRAFQPDALMLGVMLAGLRSWDRALSEAGRTWLLAGWIVLAVGLSMKVISAYLLLPLMVPLIQRGQYARAVMLAATLLPAAGWYAWAYSLVGTSPVGSFAQSRSFDIWKSALFSISLWDAARLSGLIRFLLIRSFTPIGSVLGVVGWFARSRGDRFWTTWAIGLAAAFVAVSGKIHHEYYWMAAAPLLAVGLARNLVAFARVRKWAWFGGFSAAFVLSAVALSLSTFRTPVEWQGLEAMAAKLRSSGVTGPIIGSEAIIYYAGGGGCRLELDPNSAIRAAEEVGGPIEAWQDPDLAGWSRSSFEDPKGLVDFYLIVYSHGTVVGLDGADPREARLRDALRNDPRGTFREWPGIGWIWEGDREPAQARIQRPAIPGRPRVGDPVPPSPGPRPTQ